MTATVAETATLVHDFTMAEVQRIARYCANYGDGRNLDASDRYDCAWFGVVEHLYAAVERPTGNELIVAGRKAVRQLYNDHLRHHGIDKNTLNPAPNFAKFWFPPSPPEDGFSEKMIERLALPQVLSKLTPIEYQAITTLAIHGSREGAAAALGIPMGTFNDRIIRARDRIARLWMAPETVPKRRPRISEEACRSGHARAEHGYKTNAGKWACRICLRRLQRAHRARRA